MIGKSKFSKSIPSGSVVEAVGCVSVQVIERVIGLRVAAVPSTTTLETVIVAPLIELDIEQVIVAVASTSLLTPVSSPVVSVTAYILNVGVIP